MHSRIHNLQELNRALARRNAQLTQTNRRLAREVTERRRTEKALRDSETHYHQLFFEACRMQERLRRLSKQILDVQEEERKRMSRDLHDQVGQTLTAIHTNLALLQKIGPGDPTTASSRIADSQNLLRETMDTVRRFSHELRPAMLDELGLLPALRSFLKDFAERTGLAVRFQQSAEVEKLGAHQKTVLFRVVQEGLTNVLKHARARQVVVVVRAVGNEIQLQVNDNGRGFAEGAGLRDESERGLGVLGMQERLRLVGGRFTLESAPGKGTTMRVSIPLTPAKGDDHKHEIVASEFAKRGRSRH